MAEDRDCRSTVGGSGCRASQDVSGANRQAWQAALWSVSPRSPASWSAHMGSVEQSLARLTASLSPPASRPARTGRPGRRAFLSESGDAVYKSTPPSAGPSGSPDSRQ